MKKLSRILAVLLVVCMILAVIPTAFAEADYSKKTVILHSNDVHGNVAGYAYMAALKAEFEAAGAKVILADAGDFSQGTTYVSLSKGANAVDMMNAVGYDVATLGNHEFDYGAAQLFENLEKASFKVVCSDVLKDGKAIYDPYTIIDGDVKVAFVGLETPEAQTKANPALIQGLTFLTNESDPTLWANTQATVDAAKAAGAEIVIGLTHLGVDNESAPYTSYDLYENVKGLDFIIDAHSHTEMEKGDKDEPIQSTGTAFANIGVIVIDNETKKIDTNFLQPIDAETSPKDEEVAAAAQKIIDDVTAEYGAKFAESKVDLNGAKAPNGNRDSETNNGDLITDAMIWCVTEQYKGSITEVPTENIVAITNGGGIRAAIKTGDVTKNDIFTVLPFGNTVAVVYVTGAELLEALEASTYCTPEAVGGFPQIAGMKIAIDTTKAYDANEETYPGSTYYGPKSINRVTIKEINGKAFDPEAKYAVVTNNFCAGGGDTYYAFAAATSQFDTGYTLDTVVMDYITEKLEGVIGEEYAAPQGRIKITYEPFTDVTESNWFFEPVCKLFQSGIIKGMTATTFVPAGDVTRAEFVTFLYRLDGEKKAEAKSIFTDVKEGNWFYDQIVWAAENGIVNGVTPTEFKPNDKITREQIVTILFRYASYANLNTAASADLTEFADANKVSSYAVDAMKWAVASGIIKGDEKNNINPKGNATRAEAAAMIYRFEGVPAAEASTILYTNDVHTYIDKALSYDSIAAYKQELAKDGDVLLVDAGDHIQGTAYGGMDKGETIIKLMNAAGYDLATLGNHEFDYGMERALKLKEEAEYPYISCNFYHEKDGVKGDAVLDSYKVFNVGGRRVAFVGVTTPETFTKSTPKYFQDEEGNYIYGIAGGADGKALYETVQAAIDEASKKADIVIGLGHLGDDPASAPWTSEEVIANTTGFAAFIDGHSHSTVASTEVKDKNGNVVILSQTGNYFASFGKMTIAADGKVSAELVTEYTGSDAAVKEIKDSWMAKVDGELDTKIAESEINFTISYDNGKRAIRSSETNLGDLNADAYYWFTNNAGLEPDMAIMNGGGIRAKVDAGEWTYKTCKTVNTFGNVLCVVEITGQQILDALEFGARFTTGDPEDLKENGGFLQVAGCTYEIDTSVANTVKVDDKNVWTGAPDAYRVSNVKIYNKETKAYEPLDLAKTYRVAGTNYTLYDCGDGFDMFKGGKHVLDGISEDYLAMAGYLQAFKDGKIATANSPLAAYENYLINYETATGAGRIVIK